MQKVLVRHSSRDGRTKQAKPKIQDIRHFYLNGKISTTSGDVWDVKRVEHVDYSFVTVAPVDE